MKQASSTTHGKNPDQCKCQQKGTKALHPMQMLMSAMETFKPLAELQTLQTWLQ
jgi:hypothetical protein